MDDTREPFGLEGYSLGDEGKPGHFDASMSRADAAKAAGTLKEKDAAFIKRSDLKWTYAILTDVLTSGDVVTLRFDVDIEKNRKSFPQNQWGKYIRVISPDALKAQAAPKSEEKVPGTPAPADKDPKSIASVKETPKVSNVSIINSQKKESPKSTPKTITEVTKKDETSASKVDASKSAAQVEKKSSGGWFGSFFGGNSPSKSASGTSKPPSPVPTATETLLAAPECSASAVTTPPAEGSVETPLEKHSSDNSKGSKEEKKTETEKPDEATPTVGVKAADEAKPAEVGPVPSSATDMSGITDFQSTGEFASDLVAPLKVSIAQEEPSRSPLTPKKTPTHAILKNFKFSLKKNRQSERQGKENVPEPNKQEAAASEAKKEDTKMDAKQGEWFDSEACECDYDVNPTDLFQALEARQFDYAEEMYKQVKPQFTRDCKTWVVARGEKNKKQLRFRALPLHAAIVFGAPDDMIRKILAAYPKAAQGRDVKGRLPMHLVFEHNTSDEVLDLILEAFPKAIFSKDKKDLTPLDHADPKGPRAFQAKYLRRIIEAKSGEEEERWQKVTEKRLEEQKASLKEDEEFLADVIQHTHDELELYYESKFEILEAKHKDELLEIRKKHDSETKALLDGFEVKLNFERKLRRLKENN